MNTLSWLIYVANVVDGLRDVGVAILIITAIVVGVLSIASIIELADGNVVDVSSRQLKELADWFARKYPEQTIIAIVSQNSKDIDNSK